MRFEEMPYTRPDLAGAAQKLEQLATAAKAAENGEALLATHAQMEALSDEIDTMRTLVSIRHTVDTRDEYYDRENDYFDENSPVVGDKALKVYRAMLASPYSGALAEKYGDILLDKMKISVQSSDERLIPLQQEENALETEYEKLYASAQVEFGGQTLTIPQLTPYKQDPDRAIRRAAYEAEGTFFDSCREQLDEIYSKMVQNRTKQANTLGFDTFTPLGDIRMMRLGYTREEIVACREEVIRGIVPVVAKLKEQQAARIGVEKLRFYDDPLSYPEGNPKPKGTPEEILEAGRTMYRGLSAETAEFMDFMMDNGLLDVLSKPGKAPGGYCTYIPGYKSPFIFSNFNGTAGDVDVLTHEAGHAFAAYEAAKQDLTSELRSPGLESCEIHSMSMEFLTADYHHLFFKEDTARYETTHLQDALFFLPYGCQVDEFQQEVYERPHLTPEECNMLWLELEAKYRPWNDFDGLPFYSRGAGWQRQLHIYEAPFYYIDYVLAQAVALEFFLAREADKQDAWQRYMALVQKAGTLSYTGLVGSAGFKTPFEKGALSAVGSRALAWLEKNATK